jgi:hypothetical protein
VPDSLFEAALKLSLDISDGIPKIIREPSVSVSSENQIEIVGLAQIGGAEPNHTICWVPSTQNTLQNLWGNWVAQIHDLMTAGYPGCVGCGGPGSEGVWDELASRARTRVN